MKILMYSIYAFDKPFIENATHGKLNSHIQTSSKEDTVKLAEGLKAFPFTPLIMPQLSC
jgi:D-lactate dehydrogenase